MTNMKDKRPSSQANPTVTRDDVARLANVSHGTVTNVLSGKAYVKAETREKVLKAIEALHYRPNLIARSLRSHCTGQIGLILPDLLSNPFNVGIISGIEEEAMSKGYVVLIAVAVSNFAPIVHAFLDRQVDAVILADAPDSAEELAGFYDAGIPMVTCGFNISGAFAIPSVKSDFTMGTRLAVDHIASLGHTRIGLLPGRRRGEDDTRLNGWLEQLGRYGLKPIAIEYGDYSYESVTAIAPAFLKGAVTAVIVGSDLMAAALLDKALEEGIPVPGRLSVIGYDDSMAYRTHPPLTTIRAHDKMMGSVSCRIALDAIKRSQAAAGSLASAEASDIKLEHHMSVELVVRRSTGLLTLG